MLQLQEPDMVIHVKEFCLSSVVFFLLFIFLGSSGADPVARTESICNLGMIKGEAPKSCRVPIPADCSVANFPGYEEPWVDVSKAGLTSCQIDTQQTDWTTKIIGTCGECTSDQCSGRFSVMFNCTHNIPPANPQTRTR